MLQTALKALFFTLFVLWVLLMPAKVSPNDASGTKFVIDRAFLEHVRYPVWLKLWDMVTPSAVLQSWLPMDTPSLVKEARMRTGIDDNVEFWKDPVNANYSWMYLDTLTRAMSTEAAPYISPLGWIMQRETIITGLVVQLRMQRLIKQHPEILNEVISKPIVIAGPPRTMTTHAQAILAQHSNTYHLRLFEIFDPTEPDDPAVAETDQDPRKRMASFGKVFNTYICPLFKYMFELEAPMEDIHWMGNVFSSSLYEVNVNVPTYSKLWHSSNNEPAYRFLKVTQQVVQWQHRQRAVRENRAWNGPKRWIMKTPEHAGFLKNLMSVYPDAQIVLTHRDPVSIVSSFCAMVPYIASFWNARIDAPLFAMNNVIQLEKRLNHLVDQIDLVPPEQVYHLPFEHFVKDNLGVILRVCEFVGLDTSPENINRMRAYIESKPRQGATVLEYRIETLGPEFTKAELRKRFHRYQEKFSQYIL